MKSNDSQEKILDSIGALSEVIIIFYLSVKEQGLGTDEALGLTCAFLDGMTGQMKL